MALRNPQALLGTYIRAGVLCLAPSARTCLAHGLPATPDSFSFTPMSVGASAALASNQQIGLESWDSTYVSFTNSSAVGAVGYLRAAVEHSYVS